MVPLGRCATIADGDAEGHRRLHQRRTLRLRTTSWRSPDSPAAASPSRTSSVHAPARVGGPHPVDTRHAVGLPGGRMVGRLGSRETAQSGGWAVGRQVGRPIKLPGGLAARRSDARSTVVMSGGGRAAGSGQGTVHLFMAVPLSRSFRHDVLRPERHAEHRTSRSERRASCAAKGLAR